MKKLRHCHAERRPAVRSVVVTVSYCYKRNPTLGFINVGLLRR